MTQISDNFQGIIRALNTSLVYRTETTTKQMNFIVFPKTSFQKYNLLLLNFKDISIIRKISTSTTFHLIRLSLELVIAKTETLAEALTNLHGLFSENFAQTFILVFIDTHGALMKSLNDADK